MIVPLRHTGYISVLMSVWLIGLFGCSATGSSQRSISPPAPIFNESNTDQSYAYEREQTFRACTGDQPCDRFHFIRAIIAVHGNPESAVLHFREVMSIAPNSRLANLSASWLKKLQISSKFEDKEVVTQTNEWLLLELLNGERGLKQELRLRERKLEELSKQLNALKKINLEMKERNYVTKPRINATPDSNAN